MKKIIYLLIAISFFTASCDNSLDVESKGVLSEDQVSDDPDGLLISAYASLGNDHYNIPFSLWPYGSVRSDDAYKGGRDESDITDFYLLETFTNVTTEFDEVDGLWYYLYVGISRANAALKVINEQSESAYPKKTIRQAEARFLRGYWYFMLKTLFKYVPYIDENLDVNDYEKVSNRQYTNDELWDLIAADFRFAVNNLPESQSDVGRANKYAAAAYLAKTRLYQAYEQDEENNITEINDDKLKQVVELCDTVISSTYSLESDFAYNFMPGDYENGLESIFAVQYSQDDGTDYGRLNFGDVLATPQGIGCCDFHKPSQNLVNAYRTGTDGLPLFDTYNDADVDLDNNTVDPRLDHTVCIPGHPYKYETSVIYEDDWNRTPDVYGYYASAKENVPKDCDCLIQVGPFYGNSKNRILIRYSDVLLWKAEALIELGRQNEALSLINQVRERASNSTALLKMEDGTYESNYKIATYQDGVNCSWTQDYARQALRWERRLEFAMEGSRFFDLVRWGTAESVLNSYFKSEQNKRAYLQIAHFTKNRDEYLPIPYNQMNYAGGVYTQNTGY